MRHSFTHNNSFYQIYFKKVNKDDRFVLSFYPERFLNVELIEKELCLEVLILNLKTSINYGYTFPIINNKIFWSAQPGFIKNAYYHDDTTEVRKYCDKLLKLLIYV
jgi:hypothetical protein